MNQANAKLSRIYTFYSKNMIFHIQLFLFLRDDTYFMIFKTISKQFRNSYKSTLLSLYTVLDSFDGETLVTGVAQKRLFLRSEQSGPRYIVIC